MKSINPISTALQRVLAVASIAALSGWSSSCVPAPKRPTPRIVSERFVGTRKPIAPISLDLPVVEDPVEESVQDAVAQLELSLPSQSPFVLHGTVPVPPGVYPRDDGLSPFSVVGPNGKPAPAQVEIVSRSPEGDADVVEVLALVESSRSSGSRVRYDVVLDPNPDTEAPVSRGGAERFLAVDGDLPILLRTRDVYGHTYAVDLRGLPAAPGYGSRRVLKSGRAARQIRTHGSLVPVARSETELGRRGAPLPHLMGVHAYLTQWAGDDRLSLDLRVHNGAISGSRKPHPHERPAGIIYWESLELVLPKDWSAVAFATDPFLGKARVEGDWTVIPIVRANDDGSLHMMGPQAQFNRRFAIVPRSRESEKRHRPFIDGLAFSVPGKGLWSWENPRTSNFLPQRAQLPSWDRFRAGASRGPAALRALLAEGYESSRRMLAEGTSNGRDVQTEVLGWAHPWFHRAQGATGGTGIQFLAGHQTVAAASVHGYMYLALIHRMNASRQPEALFNRFGDVVGYHEWLTAEGLVPFDFRTNGNMRVPAFKLPCDKGPEASDHVREVHLSGRRPWYDQGEPHIPKGRIPGRLDNLLSWMPHDGQHMSRYTKNIKALVWIGNDALARDDLILSAEKFHLMFHESEHKGSIRYGGVTLLSMEKHAEKYPHQGAWIGRDQAWGIDAMCAAYSTAPVEWRIRNRDWFTRVARFLLDAATPGGILQRSGNGKKILGHSRYDAAQSFESLLLLHAHRCLNASVFRGVDDALRGELEELVIRTLDYMYFGPLWGQVRPKRARESETRLWGGPRTTFPVAHADNYTKPPFSDASYWGPNYLPEPLNGGVESYYGWSLLAYGSMISEETHGAGLENRFLQRSLLVGSPNAKFGDLMGGLLQEASRRSTDRSANWADFLARLQTLGAD